MNNDLLKYISEYFNAYPKEDYTICVNGTPTEWCGLNTNYNRVAYKLPALNPTIPCGVIYDSVWYAIYRCEIVEVSITATTMTIKKMNGKEYTFTARIKEKEEKAKDLILKTKNALYAHHINDAQDYLDKLKALMDE